MRLRLHLVLELEVGDKYEEYNELQHLELSLQRALNQKDYTVLSMGGYGHDVVLRRAQVDMSPLHHSFNHEEINHAGWQQEDVTPEEWERYLQGLARDRRARLRPEGEERDR